MSDLYDRAAAIFGADADGVHWPYGMSSPLPGERTKGPEDYERRLREQKAKQELVVSWAEQYGLKASTAGCCPRWLQRKVSRRCSPTANGYACTRHGNGQPDGHWLDHAITWLKGKGPAVITSAPYEIYDEDEARIEWWQQQDPLLKVTRGPGWYGFGTTQVIIWRSDLIPQVEPARP
jgi:hypothetical protein